MHNRRLNMLILVLPSFLNSFGCQATNRSWTKGSAPPIEAHSEGDVFEKLMEQPDWTRTVDAISLDNILSGCEAVSANYSVDQLRSKLASMGSEARLKHFANLHVLLDVFFDIPDTPIEGNRIGNWFLLDSSVHLTKLWPLEKSPNGHLKLLACSADYAGQVNDPIDEFAYDELHYGFRPLAKKE